MLEIGLELTIVEKVSVDNTAEKVGSGGLQVFATPSLIALMEKTAFNCVEKEMEEGSTTVGISVNMKHLKANVPGDKIECTAILKKIDDKKLKFEIVAQCNEKIIGTCTHERFIVDSERFMSKFK